MTYHRPDALGARARRLTRLAAALSASLALASAQQATAEPRWWWDDAPVGSLGEVSDVDIAVVADPGSPPVVLVAWVEPPTLIEGALRLTASFDGGCSFCPPVHLESLFGPDDDIALAAAPLDGADATISVAVLHAARGRLEVLHDAASIPLGGLANCGDLQDLALARRVTELAAGDADEPDIAAIADPATGAAQFHAVWHEVAPTDEEWILHARDLAGDGSDWERLAPLPSSAPLFVRQADPRVSLDLLAPAGVAVNVAWSVPPANQVLYLRSADSGQTFSATGEPPEGPPAVAAQAGLGSSGPVALDSGATPGRADPRWHGLAFFQERGPAVLVAFDAQRQQEPTRPLPEWGADQVLSSAGVSPAEGIAAAVLEGAAEAEPQEAWAFWTGPVPAGGSELFVRGGRLDAGEAVPVDVDAPPIAPVRPGDPSLSTSDPLTNCSGDPMTGECVSERSVGAARRPAAADGGGEVFLAWLDDRDGRSGVWFKRTDRAVAPPLPSLEASCPAPDERRVTVSFEQLPACGTLPPEPEPERMRRYLVYYGLDPGGPYLDTDLDGSDPTVPDTIVIEDDGGLVDPIRVDVDGLAPDTIVSFVVVPEDEAGNLFPPDFDPLARRGAAPVNEASIRIPIDCGAAEPCLHRATAASLDPTGLFLGTRAANDVAFAPPGDLPYGPCPFASGDVDPEPVLGDAAPPLIYYQVEGAGLELRLSKEEALRTVRLSWL